MSSWGHFTTILKQGLANDFIDRERLISPLLFSALFLILFSFAIGDVDPFFIVQFFTGIVFLSLFFSLQIVFSRVFEPDTEDQVFDLTRTYPVHTTAWFFAKYCQVLILGTMILIPTMILAGLFFEPPNRDLLTLELVGIALLAMAGLAALGVLVSTITLRAKARQILYPILYFPLTAPVLLAAVQTSLLVLDPDKGVDTFSSWLTLLACCDVIYITLGALLFGELVDNR